MPYCDEIPTPNDACSQLGVGADGAFAHATLQGSVVLTLSVEDAKMLRKLADQGCKVYAALSDHPTREFYVLQRVKHALGQVFS